MLNQSSPMEHLAAFAICWVFGIASCAVVQKAWPQKQGKWRFT